MRLAALCFGLLLLLTFSSPFQSGASNQDPQTEDVRGAFLTSRPQTSAKPTTTSAPSNRRRRPVPAATPIPKPTPTPTQRQKVDPPETVGRVSGQRLGLGLTLFIKDSNGLAVRVDPAHEFHAGDMVRFLLETNADGFLYIFNTTDGGAPVMIYPDPWLDEAGNFIQAHVPFEIPSSVPAEGAPDWIKFDQSSGTERVYFVFSREPLAGVPIEDDLIKACPVKKAPCFWPPAAELWSRVQKEMEAPLRVDAATKSSGRQSDAEHNAVTRGIGLAKADPEPALVMMSASSVSGMLAAKVDLIHR